MRQKTGKLAAAVLVLLLPVLAQAQAPANSLRIPVQAPEPAPAPTQAPVRMEFKGRPPAKAQPQAQPQDEEARPSKFPNIDTAKNRQDYEMSTPKADGIRLGRDQDSGDTIMGSTPQKKPRQADPYANTPIEVRPVIRGLR